jgi:hypothetical protein
MTRGGALVERAPPQSSSAESHDLVGRVAVPGVLEPDGHAGGPCAGRRR